MWQLLVLGVTGAVEVVKVATFVLEHTAAVKLMSMAISAILFSVPDETSAKNGSISTDLKAAGAII